ncbi:type II secretion system F family protein [Vibrio natriegens]|uniref:Pilus assembly protein TadC n=1 Tax=Vibrio natriegens NBRC 15636 = ATCC 14048 = DSM 759 TaxID=1219067 RepID=A0AAN1CWK2_VIBNA|nr:type II secretion system F family protein [Vibrio natriegens]ALR14780.1 pilus assembly protein TadC [Vibrio natriegens NBRC 15636 = ATCC 14048 = DSM 759]ANQ13356.1 pilus assembly protein TadC [Vibrio natriegens NBRC 15636 = ATCC 14048 = DSM 759]EPM40753.1 pilus assembly protein TadC [Vibrio natriegens NBRC 15636 = ATCC 14048 = DSM 759]MDX6027791.1 type II secretion system F family protein [Vibrio natriegens NBRC 15636 = ATCC 14048 = DSM 759]UUI11097.1 type II secretion system F family prote
MDMINNFLVNFNISQDMFFMLFILITTVLFVLTVGYIIIGVKSPVKRKLSEIASGGQAQTTSSRNEKVMNTLESLAPLTASGNEKDRQSNRMLLMNAGFHQKNALSLFYSIKSLTTIVGLLISLGLYLSLTESTNLYIYIAACAFIGLVLPDFILKRMVKQRQNRIRSGVADMLDLLVVCTESGLGFNASLRRVADEMVISHPELADEIDTVCMKIQAGKSMPDSLREFVIRTGLDEFMGLVSMLSHASRVGGSLVDSLREYTEDYRDKRQQAAEEIAAKIPVKMMFPMVLFIWPCFFIVAIGPSLIQLAEAFKQ